MTTRRNLLLGLGGACLMTAATVGYWLGAVRASPIPSTGALHYAGYLEQGGLPVDGTNNMRVRLWASATGADAADLLCETVADGVTVTAGRFRIVLDDTCTDSVRSEPDAWVEVEVEGRAFPREKLGAVPYAVTADNGVPVGTIVAFAGVAAPAGWLLCDGRSYARDTYPRLAAAVADAWGGDATRFHVPDLRGRAPIGAGAGPGLSPRPLGQIGGEETHTLTPAELPRHVHHMEHTLRHKGATYEAADVYTYSAHSYNMRFRAGSYLEPINRGDGGGDQPHKNMQPFAVVNYIIRY